MTSSGAPEIPFEQQFLSALPIVDRILVVIARRNALSASDADELAAWAKGRLVDNDYSILRKFGGRSSLPTYLTVVCQNLFRDWRNARWGRWRPSAMAERLGPLAKRLEELLWRDGHPMREAIEILRASGCTESDIELRRLAAQLPQRVTDREVGLDTVADSAVLGVDPPALDDDSRRFEALRAAIAELGPEDCLIVRMRYSDGQSVADIARFLKLDQKPLYRRIEGIQRRLRDRLRELGIESDDEDGPLSGALVR